MVPERQLWTRLVTSRTTCQAFLWAGGAGMRGESEGWRPWWWRGVMGWLQRPRHGGQAGTKTRAALVVVVVGGLRRGSAVGAALWTPWTVDALPGELGSRP